jgi:selenocysteine lyase/cysteine desulfurase/CRP-like cAMP-binding protein
VEKRRPSGISAALAGSPLLRAADARDLAATAPRWTEQRLGGGEMLWYESDPADALALLLEGDLEVTVAGQPISRVAPGEIVGEAAAFVAGEQRTASVRAGAGGARLLVLSQAELGALRLEHTSVYDVLLDRALVVLAERIEATLARISAEAAEGHWPPGADGGAPRMTRARPVVGPETPVSARPALRLLPVLRQAPDALLVAIERAMTPERVAEGDALLVEGDGGDRLYLVAEGRLEVFRKIPALRGLRLATLRAGALVGTGGLLLGRPRNASCIAARDSWVYGLDRRAFLAFGGEPGRLVREALLCALRAQLRSVGTRLARFEAGRDDRARADRPLDDFLGAAGGALAYQGGLALEQVSLAALPFRDEVEASTPGARRLIETIRGSIVGADEAIETPYGALRVSYADHADSGRSLAFIEDFIRAEVLPFYASTEAQQSGTGRQTARYREDARETVRSCVGATSEDAVIFCGSGATGAINKLVDILNLRLPPDLNRAYSLDGYIPIHRRPVVFIGPYEHHSNELPWRHSLAEVVVIDDDDDGRIDLGKLEDGLLRYAARPLKIGSFSAASSVSGIVSDVRAVSVLLHRHGALAFWDYAAAAPHAAVQMNLTDDGPDGHLAYKDAVFLSPHKLPGGPGSPGVLVVKKNLVRNTVPTQPGSGTVVLVTPESTVYRQSPERREEAGTPAIVESIRAGLAFGLEQAVGPVTIAEIEHGFIQRAIVAWQQNPNLRLLGSPTAERLAIVSFMVRYGHHYLHNNFVVALLNDLFGIQARGGCSCAGPYMHRLLGIGADLSREYVALVERGFASIMPGWAGIGFNYFISNIEFRYIVAAVDLVGRYGHLLLPEYTLDLQSGQWRHAKGKPAPLRGLGDLRYGSGKLEYPSRHLRLPEEAFGDQLEAAMRIFERAHEAAGTPSRASSPLREGDYERLRWFAMPDEVAHDLGLARR